LRNGFNLSGRQNDDYKSFDCLVHVYPPLGSLAAVLTRLSSMLRYCCMFKNCKKRKLEFGASQTCLLCVQNSM
jgi:hypothetical protein